MEPDVIASAVKCPKIMKNQLEKQCFEETSMVPIWPVAFFTFFALPMLEPKMASLKLSKIIVNAMVFGLFLSEVYASR